MISRLIESMKGKQNGALLRLIRNKNEKVIGDLNNKYVDKFRDMLK